MKRRLGSECVIRSVHNLLPLGGKPILKDEDITAGLILKFFLNTHCKLPEKNINYEINPKYLYTNDLFGRIKKLRDVFLEFDEDGSRKMDISEMWEMFNMNNIHCTEKEILNLFFKDKKIPKGEVPGLDFYNFMSFALSKEADQDFRNFMRKINEQVQEEKRAKKRQLSEDKENLLISSEEDDRTDYLPMSFNKILDYFIEKGKERESKEVIGKAIVSLFNY